jgi:RNA recognition motif-containing protein
MNADNSSKQYGYVQFSKAEAAQEAIAKWNGKKYQDKELSVSVLSKKGERETEPDNFTNLHVKGVPVDFTE